MGDEETQKSNFDNRGRERLSPSPPSEPCVRFSRTRLSSGWFPHRDWLANTRATIMVNSSCAAKKALAICLNDAVAQRANMRSFHAEASTHDRSRSWVTAPCVVPSDTNSASLSLCLCGKLTHPPSCLPSLGTAFLRFSRLTTATVP